MPRIRHWFHVSHDINSDGEVWELTDKFGVAGLRLWLELLSIADRNEGRLPPWSDSFVRQLSIKCNTTQTRVRLMCDWCETRTWVVSDPNPRVRNWAIYNPFREHKKRPSASSPNHPNQPSHPNQPKKTKAQAPLCSLELPDWLDAELWEAYKEHRAAMPKKFNLTAYAEKLALRKLEAWRAAGEDPNEIVRSSIMNGWAGIFEPKHNLQSKGGNLAELYAKPGRTTEEIYAELQAKKKEVSR